MKKSIKKANAKLAEARKYVASYKIKQPIVESTQVIKPIPTVKPKGVKVENAEIKKLQKGFFFVILTYGGQQHEIQKRFKSTTKAQEWISKHEYIEI